MSVTVSVPGSAMAPRVRLYELPSLTLAAPLMVRVGSTLLTVTLKALAWSRNVPSSSVMSTVMFQVLGPSA